MIIGGKKSILYDRLNMSYHSINFGVSGSSGTQSLRLMKTTIENNTVSGTA